MAARDTPPFGDDLPPSTEEMRPAADLRLSADATAMARACRRAGVSANAMRPEGSFARGGPVASVACPSFFCDRAQFGGLLAYFVEMGLDFAIDLQFHTPGDEQAQAAVRLYPGMDEATLAVVNAIAPGRGDAIRRLQVRLERYLDTVAAGE